MKNRNKENEENFADMMDELFNELGNKMYPEAKVSFKDFMNKPCIEITYSRRRTGIKIHDFCTLEAEHAATDIIGHVLNLIPEKERMHVCALAMASCKSKKGELYED